MSTQTVFGQRVACRYEVRAERRYDIWGDGQLKVMWQKFAVHAGGYHSIGRPHTTRQEAEAEVE